jgi:hypothetical protein
VDLHVRLGALERTAQPPAKHVHGGVIIGASDAEVVDALDPAAT